MSYRPLSTFTRVLAVTSTLMLTVVSSFAETVVETCEEDVDSCVARMRKAFDNRGTLGLLVIAPDKAPDDGTEIRWTVGGVLPGGAADQAGLKTDDVITAWNGQSLPRGVPEHFLRQVEIGQTLEISVDRNGKALDFSMVAKEPTDETMEAWLMAYVYANFSREVFEDYRARTEKRRAPPR